MPGVEATLPSRWRFRMSQDTARDLVAARQAAKTGDLLAAEKARHEASANRGKLCCTPPRAIRGECRKQRVFLKVSARRPIEITPARSVERFHQAVVSVVSHTTRNPGIGRGGRLHKEEVNSRSLRIGQMPIKQLLLLLLILKGGAPSSRVRRH